MSEPTTAPLAQFGKRHRIVQPASDVAQTQLGTPRVNPERKNALLRGPELTLPRNHPAAVNPDRKAERSAIFQGQYF